MAAFIFSWLFVFGVPWQDMVVLPGFGTMSKLLGIGAVGATALHVLLRGRVRTPVSFHWVAFAYLCWILLSTLWGVAQPESLQRKVTSYLQIFAMVWVIWETALTRSRLVNLLQAYVLGAYVGAGSTIYNYATGRATQAYERYAASGFDPNNLGSILAVALPMAWYIASTTSSSFLRWLNRAYFVVGTVAILLTSSRGALLTTIAALLVIPWTLRHLRTRVKVATVVIMIVVGVAAAWYVPSFAFRRLSTTGSEISEGTLSGRLTVWKAGLEVVPARPLQGYGPAGWYRIVRSIGTRKRASHSTYLAILVEEGMIGLLIFLALFPSLLSRLRALPTFERRVGLTLLATLGIAITPLDWDTHKALWLVLALLAVWSDLFQRPRPVTSPSRPVGTVLQRSRGASTPATVE